MSIREVRLHDLVGRTVRDTDDREVGRIMELDAEIELHEHGNEYVVRAFHVGAFRLFESLAASRFAWHALRFIRGRSYTIPWELMDLRDPSHPRVTRAISELSTDP